MERNKTQTGDPRKAKPLAKPLSGESQSEMESLQAEVKRLEKELRQEKLRADAYDMMIEIAESKYNIPIRKKAGAKR